MNPRPSFPSARNRAALMLALALTVSSCGGGGGGDPASPPVQTPVAAPARPVAQSDLQIAESIFSGAARTPEGFYDDAAPSSYGYVSTAHLKNSDLDADASQPLHELCTNDWNEALAWSETHAQQAPQYAALVETNDDARFFEFGRTRNGEPQFYLRERVFKCAYLDRSATDLRAASGPAGRLNQRPLTAGELKILSEYLWQFTMYNNFGHVVLKSAGEATSDGLAHTLHIASLVRAGISEGCDRIDVLTWRHDLDATTGALELRTQTLWSFGARESAGGVQLCAQ